MILAGACLSLAGCGSAPKDQPAPRHADGSIRMDREPGQKGFWDNPTAVSLVEEGVSVQMDANGKLANIDDAEKVAPFQPWALALYKFRQQNDFADDPMKVCMGPGNPRQMMTPGGLRILQDNNLKRVYMIFGGGNRNWRVVFMDGRETPLPEEVSQTFLGMATGKWEGDTLVAESVGFNARFWFSNGGLPHTEALKLTERFTRPTHDRLDYEVTIDDPHTYTRPWKAKWSFAWVDGDIAEHFCEDSRE
ncbi:MAG: hypothetical protein LBE59_10765 [Nevskiaceae bacterium]|nr:hypothetical protein [Nevskiaceae bacterium]